MHGALLCQPSRDVPELLTFTGARVARSAYNAKHRSLSVRGSAIDTVHMPWLRTAAPSPDEETVIDLTGFLVLPGLINAHDHLDFSLFPRLGQGPYPNWRDWAADIYYPTELPIAQQLQVPMGVRLWWGGIRNLLCGVTTVSHHNQYLAKIFEDNFPVHVPSEQGWTHSLMNPQQVVESFRDTPKDWPFIIHLAEGIDNKSQEEFDLLGSLIPLDGRIILVHGVGLTPSQRERVVKADIGLVWCPSSNLYTLGQTLPFEQIQRLPNVAMGTDSPLTATCDLLDQLRQVHQEMAAPSPFLYELVTSKAARLLRLKAGEGILEAGHKADLIAIRDRQLTPADTLVEASWSDIELVMAGGKLVLLSPSLAGRVPKKLQEGMESVFIDGIERLVRAPVQELLRETRLALGKFPSIAGRKVTMVLEEQTAWSYA